MRSQWKSVFWLLAVMLPIIPNSLLAGGPMLQHQPPTGLQHSTPGATVTPDGKGGNIVSKTNTTEDPSAGGGKTTTTVTQTRQTNKDGSTVDTTVVEKETKVFDKTKDGTEYVKSKTNSSVKTERTTDKKGQTSTASTSSGRSVEFSEPNQDGVSDAKSSQFTPAEKLENGASGIAKKSHYDVEGNKVTVTTIPGHITSTKTEYKNGKMQTVNQYPDGRSIVSVFPGSEARAQTREWYDANGELVQRMERDKNGDAIYGYQADGNDVVEVRNKNDKPKSKTVRERDGSSYEIRFIGGMPWKLIQYDKMGNKVDETIIDSRNRKDFEKNFGDDLSMGDPFSGPSSVGRDVLVGMDTVQGAPEHFEHGAPAA